MCNNQFLVGQNGRCKCNRVFFSIGIIAGQERFLWKKIYGLHMQRESLMEIYELHMQPLEFSGSIS